MINHYNPVTRQIALRADASLYGCFHELAHQEQHDTRALVFLLWRGLHRLRLVGWILTFWIEIDAYRRTRARLERLECWTAEIEKEARAALMTYFRKEPDAHTS